MSTSWRVLTAKGWVVSLWRCKSKLVLVQKVPEKTNTVFGILKGRSFKYQNQNGLEGKMHLSYADWRDVSPSLVPVVTRDRCHWVHLGTSTASKALSHSMEVLFNSVLAPALRGCSSAPKDLPEPLPRGLQAEGHCRRHWLVWTKSEVFVVVLFVKVFNVLKLENKPIKMLATFLTEAQRIKWPVAAKPDVTVQLKTH